MIQNRAVFIDGNSLIFRAFYALPPLKNQDGIATNGVYGFLTMLFKILDEYDPQYVSVAFDKKGKTFRHTAYQEYKAGRKETPSDLLVQFPIVKAFLDAMNIHRIEMDGYEADDLVASLTKRAEQEGMEIFLVTGDRDYLQLISQNTKVLLMRKGISQVEVFDEAHFKEIYQMEVDSFVHLKALMGDASDNIPGVPGVGEKTGIKLISQYKTLDGVYENLDEIKGKLKEKLAENETSARMSLKMSEMVCNLPVDFSKDLVGRKEAQKETMKALLETHNFKSFMPRFSEVVKEEVQFTVLEPGDEKALSAFMKKGDSFYFKLYGTKKSLIALILAQEKEMIYMDMTKAQKEEATQVFKHIFKEKDGFIGYSTKEDLLLLHAFGVCPKIRGDAEIAEYLIHAEENHYTIDKLALRYLQMNLPSMTDFLGKGKKALDLADIEAEKKVAYLCQRMDVLRRVYPIQRAKLEEEDLLFLYEEIELPLIEVLAGMEEVGILADVQKLHEIGAMLNQEIVSVEAHIYEYAGKTFNINSPKQLGEILFEDLGLPTFKKTKTGYSTNAEVLEKLMDKHPIVPDIMTYRQLSKLKNTYIDGLLKVIGPNGRIHSSFMQTVASTGRISSTEPNLQNIPVRTPQGREIRKVFRAKEGYCFVDADYSQIELRVLADLADDPKMKEAFNQNIDIHRRTAAEVFKVAEDEVTSEMRTRAKAVNFGIVYGISDFGLSRDLDIPVWESKELITQYFKTYPSIKDYMDEAIKLAKEVGYAKTKFGRKRPLPELQSANYNIRSFGERVAMNMPIQGTAADIIKIAMVKTAQALKEDQLKAKLILQVHDELIVEAPLEEAEEVAALLRKAMESAADMKVKLEVDLKTGASWYETK